MSAANDVHGDGIAFLLTQLGHDAATRFAVTAERATLAALGGGCQVPIGVYCERAGNGFVITGTVASPDGWSVLREELQHRTGASAEAIGRELAERLLEQGADALLRAGQL